MIAKVDIQHISSSQLRSLLNISSSTFYRLLEAGLPTIGVGRLRRHNVVAALKWYDSYLVNR